MNQSQNNGNMTADVQTAKEALLDPQDTWVSAEQAADTTLQQWNRLLEQQLTERTPKTSKDRKRYEPSSSCGMLEPAPGAKLYKTDHFPSFGNNFRFCVIGFAFLRPR